MIGLRSLTRHSTLAHFLSSSLLSLPVSLVTGFIAFRSVDPYLMGIWATMLMFETYANFLRLGIVNGMNRELPYALGAGNREEALQYASTTLYFTIGNIALLVLLTPFIALQFELNIYYIAAIAVAVLRISLSFYTTYLSGTFRSDDHFRKLSNIQYINLGIKIVTVPLVLTGFYGFLAFELLQVLSNTILLHFYRPFRLSPVFDKAAFRKLISIGLPIFLTSYMISLVDTFPRLFILRYSGERMLGLYAPVILLLSTMAMLPGTLSTYMYPKFSYHFGRLKDPGEIWRKLLRIYSVSFIFILLGILILFLFIDYFIVLFPKYRESLPYLKLALLACPFVFFKLGNMLNTILKKYNYMFFFVFIYGLIQAVTLFLMHRYFTDILTAVIYSQILTSVLVLAVSLIMNYRLLLISSINTATHE